MNFIQRLSGRQRIWLTTTLFAMATIILVGWLVDHRCKKDIAPSASVDQTIRQLAPKLGATGFSLARELDLPRKVSKKTPLRELEVDQEKLDHVVEHLLSHKGRLLKYFVYAALVLFGWVYLMHLGRPDESPPSERKSWYPQSPYLIILITSLVVCGFALGKSPNPMEGSVKILKAMVGLQPSIPVVVFAFLFFIGLAIVGNKLVCGWACPIGALQELIYRLPILKKLKRRKVPFLLSNWIRGGLFVLMLLMLFGIVGGKKGFVLYHSLNPFNLFDLHFENALILTTVIVVVVLSFATYRPFCHFICPFGFVSWLAERFSLAGIRVDHSTCNECGACYRACPVEAAQHLVAGKRFAADCYSCARCLNVCPLESITYGPKFTLPAKNE